MFFVTSAAAAAVATAAATAGAATVASSWPVTDDDAAPGRASSGSEAKRNGCSEDAVSGNGVTKGAGSDGGVADDAVIVDGAESRDAPVEPSEREDAEFDKGSVTPEWALVRFSGMNAGLLGLRLEHARFVFLLPSNTLRWTVELEFVLFVDNEEITDMASKGRRLRRGEERE